MASVAADTLMIVGILPACDARNGSRASGTVCYQKIGSAPSMPMDVLEGWALSWAMWSGLLPKKAGVEVSLLDALYALTKGRYVSEEDARAVVAAKIDGA